MVAFPTKAIWDSMIPNKVGFYGKGSDIGLVEKKRLVPCESMISLYGR